MTHVLITGMSGVGKSSAVEELRHRGYHCIDMDEPGWSNMDAEGHQHWLCDRLESELHAHSDSIVFVAGCAEEQSRFYRNLQAIVLLSAPQEVMKTRIRNRSSNSYGQDPAEWTQILDNLDRIEPLIRQSCTHEIITTCSLTSLVEQLEAIAADPFSQADNSGIG